MIYKIYPTLNDFENLSLLKVESSDFANTFDYKNLVVNKPWGYEYLWYQNESVAIWFLYVKKNHSTSLHCHALKRTSLIVLDGTVQCTTIDDTYDLHKLDSIVLEPCVFHSSKAISEEGSFIMEIETPPMKGDLVRMNDAYGRQKSGYEKTNEYSVDFDAYEYCPFAEKDTAWRFRNVEIRMTENKLPVEGAAKMVVPITGHVRLQKKVVMESGETVPVNPRLTVTALDKTDHRFLIFNEYRD